MVMLIRSITIEKGFWDLTQGVMRNQLATPLPRPYTWHKSLLVSQKNNWLRTDRPTDKPTHSRTDRPTDGNTLL